MDLLDEVDLLLTMTASGVADAYELLQTEGTLPVPYPVNLQRALDRCGAVLLARGQRPPQGVPQLLEWCAEPLGKHFPVADPDLADVRFIVAGKPTPEAWQWSLRAKNAESDRIQKKLVHEAMRRAHQTGNPDLYVVFRRFPIDHPVVYVQELDKLRFPTTEKQVQDLIKSAYTEVGPEFEFEGAVWACRDCRQLLLVDDGKLVCGNERCPRTGPTVRGKRFDPAKGVRRVKEGIRVSLVNPGLAEVRLYETLQQLTGDWPGMEVFLYPGVDAYDIGIHYPPLDLIWAVDVKDYANPRRLARDVQDIPAEPPWTRGFIVPCAEAVAACTGYVEDLNRALRRHGPRNFEIREEAALLQELIATLNSGDRDA